MKSFLLRGKRPIVKWGMIPNETYFEGTVPEGYSLAVVPSEGYVVIDVDRHGNMDGFDNVPHNIGFELAQTFHYTTKNNGMHYWVKYTGNRPLANKTSGLGIDLRTHKGYVVFYPNADPRDCMSIVNNSSEILNEWLEKLFSYVE
jgi:hypothetical protein